MIIIEPFIKLYEKDNERVRSTDGTYANVNAVNENENETRAK